MEIAVNPRSILTGISMLLIATMRRTEAANTPSCKAIEVSNTRYHPAEEGVFFLKPSATCETNSNWIWGMRERENYMYYSDEPNGWRIGAVLCRSSKAAIYSETESDSPFDVKIWREWNFDTSKWEDIELKLTCVDGREPGPILQAVHGAETSTSIGKVVIYVGLVVVIIGVLIMFQRRKQKTQHIL